MTYRKAETDGDSDGSAPAAVSDNDIVVGESGNAKKIAINEDMLRIQVREVLVGHG